MDESVSSCEWLSPPIARAPAPISAHPPHVVPRISVSSASFARLALRVAGRRVFSLTIALGLVAGCDIPNGPPQWETHWVLRTESTTIPVASFFPSEVTELDGEFRLSAAGGAVSETLGTICQECAPYNGRTVPKPAFVATLRSEVPFPVDLDSITLTRGSLQVRVSNRLAFDPIRPVAAPGGARGRITITISNGSAVLATHVIDGATTSFAPGSTLNDVVTLSPAGLPRTVGGAMTFGVTIESPAGDPVTVNTAEYILIEAAEASFGASGATVRVQDRHVSAQALTLDLAGIDAELTSRVQRGSLLLDIANPFAVGGVLTATLSAPGVMLVRSLPIVPGTSSVSLDFSGAELRTLFGPSPVTLSVSGPVSATPARPVSVLPGQALRASGRLELYVTTNSPEAGQ